MHRVRCRALDDFIAPPACCTQGSHRDKRAKTSGAIVDPMDENMMKKCDQLVKSLLKLTGRAL